MRNDPSSILHAIWSELSDDDNGSDDEFSMFAVAEALNADGWAEPYYEEDYQEMFNCAQDARELLL